MRRSSGGDAPPPSTPGLALTIASDSLIFIPTPSQRQVKARLLVRLSDNPLLEHSSLSLSESQSITGSSQIKDWWGRPGFKEWFLDQNEYRQRLEYLFALALDAAEEILLSTDPKSQGARVSMIKLLAELANKIPKENAAKYLDESISKMDRGQLESFLEKSGITIPQIGTK